MTGTTALEERWALEAAEEAAAAAARAVADAAASAEAKKDHEDRVESIKDHLPKATGWRVIVLPYRGARKPRVASNWPTKPLSVNNSQRPVPMFWP